MRPNRRYLKPISRRTLLDYFHELKATAGVTHLPGRGWYGLRRLWTDLGEEHVKSSRGREILSSHARGSKVPEQVYRPKQDEAAIREAARGRAMIREALRNDTVSDVSALRAEAVRVIHGTPDLDLLRAVLELLGTADPTTNGRREGDAAAPNPTGGRLSTASALISLRKCPQCLSTISTEVPSRLATSLMLVPVRRSSARARFRQRVPAVVTRSEERLGGRAGPGRSGRHRCRVPP